MERHPHIHCPRCAWEPRPDSRWRCAAGEPGSGCGTVWNTFWTAGCCPGCGHYWAMTQCLSCRQASPHEAWYHFPPPEGGEAQETKEALETTG
ncbi:MAG TPA: hypothetical protein VF415_01150 [Rhodanobacter sp.]